MFKKITALMMTIVIVLSLSACGASTQNPAGNTIKDRNGREITLPAKVEGIVSLSPAVTQILVDLGIEEKLVAVDIHSLPYIKDQAIMTLDAMSPNPEVLLSLNADIYFVTDMGLSPEDDPLTPISGQGGAVVHIPVSNTIEEIKVDLIMVANIVEETAAGERLIATMEEKISEFESIAAMIGTKKRVYFEVDLAPEIYSFGSGVFLNEALEIVGAENIFAGEVGWLMVSPEKVVSANPDVIITSVNYVENPVEEIKVRQGFSGVKAVVENRVFQVPDSMAANSNHRIVDSLEILATTIYPAEYAER